MVEEYEDGDEEYGLEDELIEASENGDVEKLRDLKSKGVNLNFRDPEDGSTAAINAAWGGHAEFLQELVDTFDEDGEPVVDLNAQANDGGTAATCACWAEHTDCVKILANATDKKGKMRVDFAIQDNEGGDAYDCAEEKGNKEIMDIVNDAEEKAAKPVVSLKAGKKAGPQG